MQYHFDGFRSGDPSDQSHLEVTNRDRSQVDVLIVGCGPAGLTLAAQLAAFPDINTRIIDKKTGPLEFGQADGIACRSMEMFEAFGFAGKVAREAYWVNETAFWHPDDNGELIRGNRIQDVEDDLSEMPHVILSQARVHDFYLEVMAKSARRLTPDYGQELISVTRRDDAEFPVTVQLQSKDGARTETVCARYVVGCDGAHSAVRQALGYALEGKSARQLWGVMDVLAVTDFPDIRLKCAIQSAGEGSLLIIPREGGAMIRTYIELDDLGPGERAADRNVTPDLLIEKAGRILSPYSFDVRDVAWCSAYEIGQRVCPAFDDRGPEPDDSTAPRIFIAGDACHTHSPKAGQGMNVSMADTFNLGWKLAAVLRGQATEAVLGTYASERKAKAQELIDFDRDMAKLFSSREKTGGVSDQFQSYFRKHGRYTAGVETRYDPSLLILDDKHQSLARGLKVGMRFHSAPVIRLADAKPVHLGHVASADGRWRLMLFAPDGDRGQPGGTISGLCRFLETDATSPLLRYTSPGSDLDSVIDVRAVFQFGHRDLSPTEMPGLLMPPKGRFGLTDYEKVFCPDKRGSDIFDLRGIDQQNGAMVILRPDQFVAGVLPLQDTEGLAGFFDRFMVPANG